MLRFFVVVVSNKPLIITVRQDRREGKTTRPCYFSQFSLNSFPSCVGRESVCVCLFVIQILFNTKPIILRHASTYLSASLMDGRVHVVNKQQIYNQNEANLILVFMLIQFDGSVCVVGHFDGVSHHSWCFGEVQKRKDM